ncbi:MAG: type 1 glutamine amidotransferase [Planctomycetota bacterium]|jgi:GMP synthase-like glutamine amidotransferase
MAIIVFEHSDQVGIGRLGEALRGYGHRLRIVRLHAGEVVPGDLDDTDGVVTCGGPQSARDDEPWLGPQMRFLRSAHEQSLPVVGICLGSQILANAIGGEVGPLESGLELGWVEVRLTDAGREDILHTGLPWRSFQPQWHRDQVTKLPPGGRLLAASDRCPVQAWSVGLRTYGFQYHPEIVAESLPAWVEEFPQAMEDAGITAEQLQEQTNEHYPAFHRVSERLFESISLFLMPADRRNRGLVKDLHH